MKKLLYLLVVLQTTLFAQYNNTFYIDPTNQGDPLENGSVDHPYDSWSDISPVSNSAYLQKRGTVETRTAPIITLSNSSGDLHDILIGAYGSGDRPQVRFSGTNGIYLKYTRRITVENIELIGNSDVTSGVFNFDAIKLSGHTSSAPNTSQTTIRNCKIHRWGCGVNCMIFNYGTIIDTLTVDNTEIFDIGDDGIFGGIENLTVKNSHIYRVNRHWFTIGHSQLQSGGDCIHFRGNNYLIQNNILERKMTGNKFCLIYGSHTYHSDRGRILWNTFYPPQDTLDDDGGACIYVSQSAYVEIAYNKFIGRGYAAPNQLPGGGAHLEADTVNFYFNLADSVNGFGVTMDDYLLNKELNFMNNTFINQYDQSVPVIITFDSTTARNNVFALHEGVEPFSYYGDFYPDTSHNIIVNGNSANWELSPGFVNWQNFNYRLNENSPLVNAGSNYSGYNTDLDSVAAPQQDIRDIGAFEYNAGILPNSSPEINDQSFLVEENTSNGELVGIVEASDPDPGQALFYSILSGNIEAAFYLNNSTGEIYVNNNTALDYEQNTEFYLTIQVQDDALNPLSDQAIVTIIISDLAEPVANFSANTQSLVVGENVSFINTSENNPTNYVWMFFGGTPSTSFEENPVILYNTPGIYDVRLLAVNSNGNDVLIKSEYIEVFPDTTLPIANFSASSTTISAGGSVSFSNESLNEPSNFMWQFIGGDPITSFDENPTIVYENPGLYNVKLVAVNSNGNDVLLKTNYIEVVPNVSPPVADFTANLTTIIAGESITFQDESLNDPTNLIWQFVGGSPLTSFEASPTIIYSTPGFYNVRLVAINSYGNDVLIKTNYVEVLPNLSPPVADFSSNISSVIAGGHVEFFNQSLNNPTNLVWQFVGGSPITSFDDNPVIIYNEPGMYNVKLLAINPYGNDVLIKTDFIEVLPNIDPPVAEFSSNTTSIMAGESVEFYNESTNNPTNYVWQFFGGTPLTSIDVDPVVNYNTPGLYNVKLVAINPYGNSVVVKTDYIEVFETNGSFITSASDEASNDDYYLIPYPNPATEYIVVNLPPSIDNDFEIKIYNLNGELFLNSIINQHKTADRERFDISYLPKGSYIIHLYNESISVRKKFIKY